MNYNFDRPILSYFLKRNSTTFDEFTPFDEVVEMITNALIEIVKKDLSK